MVLIHICYSLSGDILNDSVRQNINDTKAIPCLQAKTELEEKKKTNDNNGSVFQEPCEQKQIAKNC